MTAKARSAIRHYLKSLRRGEAIELGRRCSTQALAEFELTLDAVEPDGAGRRRSASSGCKNLDELYEKIGLGERLAPLVARRLLPRSAPSERRRGLAPLAVAGTEGLLVSYARCCYPLPHEPILAFLSRRAAAS